MGVYDGQPVAVFTGPYPPSGAYSPLESIVERTSPGVWQKTDVPVPYNAGFFHFSPVQFGANLEILGTTYGGFGDLLMTRSGGYGGAWTSQFFGGFTQDIGGNLVNLAGTPAFFSAIGSSNSYYSMIGSAGLVSTEVKPGGQSAFAVGSDLQVINGIPTMAFLNRKDAKLHFDQLIDASTTTDLVLDFGNASWTQAVSVFPDADGNAAVAAIIEKGNSSQVVYYSTPSVPEPAGPLSALLLLLASLLYGGRAGHSER
jgi:hypothetical protein